MSEHDEIWLPLVDEPIGSIVQQLQADDPEIERLVGSPRRRCDRVTGVSRS